MKVYFEKSCLNCMFSYYLSGKSHCLSNLMCKHSMIHVLYNPTLNVCPKFVPKMLAQTVLFPDPFDPFPYYYDQL